MFGLQLYVGPERPTPEQFIPICNSEHYSKPIGGLWTSSYDQQRGSSWVQWCLKHKYRVPEDGVWQSWLLEPSSAAKIYTVDTVKDINRLMRNYGQPFFMGMISKIDFEAVAQDYDAIHLTEQGQAVTKHLSGLYAWDCETVLWLRWCVVQAEELGCIPYHRN